jgi:hypothetical protein
MRDVVEQLARRLERGFCARHAEAVVLEQAPGLALDAGEGLPQSGADRHRAVLQRGHDQRGHPQHAPRGFLLGPRQQGFDGFAQFAGIGRSAVLRPRRHRRTQTRQQRRRLGVARRARCRHRERQVRRQWPFEVWREQHAFAQAGLAARGAQLVEQRQQHDRDVLVPALQPLEVIGQQHHAAHERGAGGVAVADVADLQGLRELFHLLGHHRRRVQLDHAQRALHLVQVAGAEAHAATVAGILGEAFDLDPRLAQGLVELGLDPTQRGVVDRVAQGRHCAAPCSVETRKRLRR